MGRGKRCRGRALWLLALCALSGCADAPAPPRPSKQAAAVALVPPFELLNGTAPIPGNGGLLIRSQQGQPLVEVRARTASETPIAGTVRQVADRLWVWVADATLAEGTYDVIAGTTVHVIQVTGERTFQKPALTSAPVTGLSNNGSEYACCESPDGGHGSFDETCFVVVSFDSISLSPGLATTESATALTQLLFEIRPAQPGAQAQPSTFGALPFVVFFDQEAHQYCFDLEAIEIATGERYTFEELPRCAPHGDLPPPGRHEVPVPDSVLDKLVCGAPPEGFEERWCMLNPASCGGADPRQAGADADADEDAGGPTSQAGNEASCTVRSARRMSDWAQLVTLVAALALYARRRRRSP